MKKINNYFAAEHITESIIHFRLFPISPTIEEFREHLDFLKNTVDNGLGREVIWVYDTEGALLVNSECRKEGGEFIKEHLEGKVKAIVFYNQSLLIDLSLKGMSIITKLPFKIVAASRKEDALEKAKEIDKE